MTPAILHVSRATYEEIRVRLMQGADEVGKPGDPIDMTGLAVAPDEDADHPVMVAYEKSFREWVEASAKAERMGWQSPPEPPRPRKPSEVREGNEWVSRDDEVELPEPARCEIHPLYGQPCAQCARDRFDRLIASRARPVRVDEEPPNDCNPGERR